MVEFVTYGFFTITFRGFQCSSLYLVDDDGEEGGRRGADHEENHDGDQHDDQHPLLCRVVIQVCREISG